MGNTERNILITNDDGIDSPGLLALANELASLGKIWMVAPSQQFSGAGRASLMTAKGLIEERKKVIGGIEQTVYAVDGMPAQAIHHGILEICPQKPDLVVSGINYGENLSTDVSISGTVGAALEGASWGIPALAVSVELVNIAKFLDHSTSVDFSTTAWFARKFSELLLEKEMPEDVQVLKLDVPHDATPETNWQITHLGRNRVFTPHVHPREDFSQPVKVTFEMHAGKDRFTEGSDVIVLKHDRLVSVTPLSLDMTSRMQPNELDTLLRSNGHQI
ncbi:MAG: 5'/3'-nucleotidase SurE [Anaerolineaceae bacterium]|nr:5'/3'-nucleotidase SurE [Anaerolineaceae bacterium]